MKRYLLHDKSNTQDSNEVITEIMTLLFRIIYIIFLLLLISVVQLSFANTRHDMQNRNILRYSPASVNALKLRYSEPEQCLISKLAAHLNCSLPHDRVIELSEHLSHSLLFCRNKSIELIYTEVLKVKGCIIPNSGYFCFKHSRPLQLEDGNCGINHVDRLEFLTSQWENLDPPVHKNTLHHGASLLQSLISLNFRRIYFGGDSVIGQIKYHLLDNWLKYRERHPNSTFNPSDINMPDKFIGFIPCGLTKQGSMAKNKYGCFTTNNSLCTDENQALFMRMQIRNWTKEYNQQSDTSRSIILMHPWGTHIWNVPQDLGTVRGVAMGIIASAKEALKMGNIYMVLESPAQHFIYDRDSTNHSIQNDFTNNTGIYLPYVANSRGSGNIFFIVY